MVTKRGKGGGKRTTIHWKGKGGQCPFLTYPKGKKKKERKKADSRFPTNRGGGGGGGGGVFLIIPEKEKRKEKGETQLSQMFLPWEERKGKKGKKKKISSWANGGLIWLIFVYAREEGGGEKDIINFPSHIRKKKVME